MIGIKAIRGGSRSVFFGNTVALASMQIVKYLFPLLTLPYLARVLGPDTYAIRAYVVSFMVFIQAILDFGFAQYGTKIVAENSANLNELSRISSNVYIAKMTLSLVGAAITAVAAFFIPILANNPPFLALSFCAVALKALLPDYVLQGLEDMKAIAYRFAVTQTLALVSIVLLVKGPEQLLLVPVFEGAASLLSVVWAEVYLRRRYSIRFSRVALETVRGIVAQSAPFFFAVAASAFMASTITVLMGFFPTESIVISCWAIAATVVQGIQALWQPISKSLFPHMVKRRDAALVAKLLKIGLPCIGGIVVACMFASDSIMLVMGGEEYVQGAYVLCCIAPTLIFSYPIALLGYPVIGALGRPSSLSRCVAISASFQLLFLVGAGWLGQFNMATITIARIGSEALLLCLEAVVVRSLVK